MIQGLRLASIWSEDLNNLLPFYRDTLGLAVGMGFSWPRPPFWSGAVRAG